VKAPLAEKPGGRVEQPDATIILPDRPDYSLRRRHRIARSLRRE
jgi:hypothetical protein